MQTRVNRVYLLSFPQQSMLTDKHERLKQISVEIENCQICKQGKTGKAVSGEGNPNARIVFIGEAPGRTEAETGRPFVGRSGKLLRAQITNIGLKEKDVFITSPVKYLPKKKTPSKSDIIHGRIHLNKQLKIINPQIIVLLGNTAIQAVLEKSHPIYTWHGKKIKRHGKTYLLLFHPAAALRFVRIKKLFLEDFEKLKQYI